MTALYMLGNILTFSFSPRMGSVIDKISSFLIVCSDPTQMALLDPIKD